MMNKKTMDRIKGHLGRTEPENRQVFRKAVKALPWYSVHRLPNMIILGTLMCAIIMSKPLYDLYYGFQRGMRFERERKKFRQQLDEEEREEEIRSQQ